MSVTASKSLEFHCFTLSKDGCLNIVRVKTASQLMVKENVRLSPVMTKVQAPAFFSSCLFKVENSYGTSDASFVVRERGVLTKEVIE